MRPNISFSQVQENPGLLNSRISVFFWFKGDNLPLFKGKGFLVLASLVKTSKEGLKQGFGL